MFKTKLIGLSITVMLTFGVIGVAGASSDELRSSRVHVAETRVEKPKTDGTYVVWAEEVSLDNWDVLGANLETGAVFPIATGGDASRSDPVVDDGVAVWSEGSDECPVCQRDIVAMDLTSGDRFTIASGPADQTRPAISSGWVVWVEDDGEGLARLRAASLDDPEHTSTLSLQHSLEHRPKIDGDRVVWVEQQGFYTERQFRLVSATIGADDLEVIEDFDGNFNGRRTDNHFDVRGSSVYYFTPSFMLVRVDTSTGERSTLHSGPFHVQTMAMDDRYIIGHTPYALQSPNQLIIWDLQTSSEYAPPADVSEALPDIENGVAVWQRAGGANGGEIHSRPIADLLPTTPQPPPSEDDPHPGYHPETGLYLSGGFSTFWHQSGGLPVFGHPLSAEFREVNPDVDILRTVQYFERQRFEYHPELRDTPYEVQLGRLGASDAEDRGLIGNGPFQPITSTPATGERCDEFEVTGFVVCDEFLDYWQSNGLNFGDDGVSYRESLALFGYPISQPYVDDETGLLTQYFERARFELHPDNPEEHRVLLGRLGADLLDQRDW